MKRRVPVIAAAAAVLAGGAVAGVLNLSASGASAAPPGGGSGDTLTVTLPDGSTYPAIPRALSVDSFNFQQDNSTTIGSSSGGAGAGKVTFKPLQVVVTAGPEQSALFAALGTGEALGVKLHASQVGGGRPPASFDYTFSPAQLTSVAVAQSSGDAVKTTLGIDYGALRTTSNGAGG